MKLNGTGAEITREAEEKVLQNIKDTIALLPCLVDLTNKERIRITKLGRRYVGFLEKSLLYATTNPRYLPGYLTAEEFEKTMARRDALCKIQAEILAFSQKLRDSILSTESDAYAMARVFYRSIQAAADAGTEGAEEINRELSYRYMKQHSKKGNGVEQEPRE